MKLESIENREVRSLLEILNEEKNDMQGILTRGYKSLRAAAYVLLNITEVTPARQYFNGLLPSITRAREYILENIVSLGDPDEAVQIAFTSSGLKKLELPDEVLASFSREFIEGMTYSHEQDLCGVKTTVRERSTILGDLGHNDPANWQWRSDQVHCVLMLFAADTPSLNGLIARILPSPTPTGIRIVGKPIFSFETAIAKEHFGFADGISQPIIKGLSKSFETDDQQLINPGEFILGYKNEYDNYSPSPYVNFSDPNAALLPLRPRNKQWDLGKNGTYMVFRQMEQHVEKFWKFQYEYSREEAVGKYGKAIKLASKMVGRWPDGQPMVTCPNSGCPMDDEMLNDFYYAKLDKHGEKCPLGAHIRRTNPRDQVHTGRDEKVSLQMSKRHRMLRRGRIYGPPLEDFDIEKIICKYVEEPASPEAAFAKRGLNFICMVSDIGRQFEFVQSVWCNTSTFADLCDEVDPLISPKNTIAQPHCHQFTSPQEKVRNRYQELPEFTTIVGGAYFFMPGIKALTYILSTHAKP